MLQERPSVHVRLRVSEDALTFFDAGLEFVYFRQPTLHASHPAGGPRTGSRVSLLGSGLHALLGDESAARCRVGDVVLPLPGFRRGLLFPRNACGDLYAAALARCARGGRADDGDGDGDGGCEDGDEHAGGCPERLARLRALAGEVRRQQQGEGGDQEQTREATHNTAGPGRGGLPGGYRRLLARPAALAWHHGSEREEAAEEASSLALPPALFHFSFRLPKGSFATVMLDEVFKGGFGRA